MGGGRGGGVCFGLKHFAPAVAVRHLICAAIAPNQRAFAVFSTVAQSTIGVSRRLEIAPLLNPLLNGVKVSEWSWISRTKMTFDSSFENHGPALSVTPGGKPLVMLLFMRSQTCLYSSLLEMLK